MTSLKSIRVLEIHGYITKNHLLTTCSVLFVFYSNNTSCSFNGRVQQNGQILGHVQYSNIRAKVCTSLGVKKESTKSSSNKWTKTFYRDYFHCIRNFCAAVLNIVS